MSGTLIERARPGAVALVGDLDHPEDTVVGDRLPMRYRLSRAGMELLDKAVLESVGASPAGWALFDLAGRALYVAPVPCGRAMLPGDRLEIAPEVPLGSPTSVSCGHP